MILNIALPQKEDEQQAVIKEVFHMVSKRDDTSCNFLEGSRFAVDQPVP